MNALTRYKRITMVVLATACVAWATQSAATGKTKQKATTGDRPSSQIWNKGNLALVDEFYATDFVRHNMGSVASKDIIGLDAFKGYVRAIRTAYPDFHVTIDEEINANDRTILRWTVTGTNKGPLGEQPATGEKMKVSGVTIARMVDGKIAEEWVFWNHADVLMQLGYTMTPPAAKGQN